MGEAVHAWLVIPAFEEQARLARCLDSIDEARLPDGITWAEWLVIDDGSSDATRAVCSGWAAAHPDRQVKLVADGCRMGQALRLEQGREWYLSRAGANDVLVGTNADVILDPSALRKLLAPFASNYSLVTSWGVSCPAGEFRGRRASVFQMRLARELAKAAGPGLIRAEGRLWAFRAQRLLGFSWNDGDVVEDLQLAVAVQRANVEHLSDPDAIAWASPARGWSDFHRQTSRSQRALRALEAQEGSVKRAVRSRDASGLSHPLTLVRVVALAAVGDPAGFLAYCTARSISSLRTKLGDADSLRTWELARSTKVGFEDAVFTTRERLSLLEKACLVVRCVHEIRGWGVLLTKIATRQVRGDWTPPWAGELTFFFRDGTSFLTDDSRTSLHSIVDVLVRDVLRLGTLGKLLLRGAINVVDLGAGIGLRAVAATRVLPVGSMVCVERSPMLLSILRRNLSAISGSRKESTPATFIVEGAAPVLAESASSTLDLSGLFALVENRSVLLMGDECELIEAVSLNKGSSAWNAVDAVLMEYRRSEPGNGWPEIAEELTKVGLRLLWQSYDTLGSACFIRPSLMKGRHSVDGTSET
jgi:hypothetical protein